MGPTIIDEFFDSLRNSWDLIIDFIGTWGHGIIDDMHDGCKDWFDDILPTLPYVVIAATAMADILINGLKIQVRLPKRESNSNDDIK